MNPYSISMIHTQLTINCKVKNGSFFLLDYVLSVLG